MLTILDPFSHPTHIVQAHVKLNNLQHPVHKTNERKPQNKQQTTHLRSVHCSRHRHPLWEVGARFAAVLLRPGQRNTLTRARADRDRGGRNRWIRRTVDLDTLRVARTRAVCARRPSIDHAIDVAGQVVELEQASRSRRIAKRDLVGVLAPRHEPRSIEKTRIDAESVRRVDNHGHSQHAFVLVVFDNEAVEVFGNCCLITLLHI